MQQQQENLILLLATINSPRATNHSRRQAQQSLDALTPQLDWSVLFQLLLVDLNTIVATSPQLQSLIMMDNSNINNHQGVVSTSIRIFALNSLRIGLAENFHGHDESSSSNSNNNSAFQDRLLSFIDSLGLYEGEEAAGGWSSVIIEKTGQLLCTLLLTQSKPFHQYLIECIASISSSESSAFTLKQLICLSCIKELGEWSRDNLSGGGADDPAVSNVAASFVDEGKKRSIKSLMESLGNDLAPQIYSILVSNLNHVTSSHVGGSSIKIKIRIFVLKVALASLTAISQFANAPVLSSLTPGICDYLISALSSYLGSHVPGMAFVPAATTELLCLVMKRLSTYLPNTPHSNEQFLNWLCSVGITSINQAIIQANDAGDEAIGLVRELIERTVDIASNVICHPKRPIIPVNFSTLLQVMLDWSSHPNMMTSVITLPFWIQFVRTEEHFALSAQKSNIAVPFNIICETLLKLCYEKITAIPDSIPRHALNQNDFDSNQDFASFVNFYRSKHMDLIGVIFERMDCSSFLLSLCQQKNPLLSQTSPKESQLFINILDVSTLSSNSNSKRKDFQAAYDSIQRELLNLCLGPVDVVSTSPGLLEKQINVMDVLKRLILGQEDLLTATLIKTFSLMTGPSTDEWIAVRRLCGSLLVHLAAAVPKDTFPFRTLLPNFIFPYLEMMITKCTDQSQEAKEPSVVAGLIEMRAATLANLGIPDLKGPLCNMNEQASFIEWFIMLLNDPSLDKSQANGWISGVTVPIYVEFCQSGSPIFNGEQSDFNRLCMENKGFRLWFSLKASVLSKIWSRLDASSTIFYQESLNAFLELLQANRKICSVPAKKEINQWLSIIRQGIYRAIHLWIEKWGKTVISCEIGRFAPFWMQCVVEPFVLEKTFESLVQWKAYFGGLLQPWLKMTAEDPDTLRSWILSWMPGLLVHAANLFKNVSVILVDQIDTLEGVSSEDLDKHIELKMLLASRTICSLLYPDFINFYLQQQNSNNVDLSLVAAIVDDMATVQRGHIDGGSFQKLIQTLSLILDRCDVGLFVDGFMIKSRSFANVLDRGWRDTSKKDTLSAPLISFLTSLFSRLIQAPDSQNLVAAVSNVLTGELEGGRGIDAGRKAQLMSKFHGLFVQDSQKGASVSRLRGHVKTLLGGILQVDSGSSRNASLTNLKVPKIYSQMYEAQKSQQLEAARREAELEEPFDINAIDALFSS